MNRSFSGGQGRNRTIERSLFKAALCLTPLYFATERLRRRRRCRQRLQVVTDDVGIVLRPAEDTPYGRLPPAADPTGAMFNLSSQKA